MVLAEIALTAAALGWGLLSFGLVAHLLDLSRLRQLLQLHTNRANLGTVGLVLLESLVLAAIGVSWATKADLLVPASIAGLMLGLCFATWVAWLVLADIGRPCACSYSDQPPNFWSVIRSSGVCLVGLGALELPGPTLAIMPQIAGSLALAAGVYVLPEILKWPAASVASFAQIRDYGSDRAR